MTQVGPHLCSLRADIFVLLLTGTATGTLCDDATEIGIVRRLSTSTETKEVVLKYRRPSTLRAVRSDFVDDIKLPVDHGQSGPLTFDTVSAQPSTSHAFCLVSFLVVRSLPNRDRQSFVSNSGEQTGAKSCERALTGTATCGEPGAAGQLERTTLRPEK